MRRARTTEESPGIRTYRRMLLEKKNAILTGFGVKFDASAKFEYKAEEDQAQISHDEFVHLLLNGMDYVQLRLIEEALDRVASGHYGVCLECDELIPAKRLKALPWARYCVACQEQYGMQQERQILDEKARPFVAGHN